MIKIKSNTSETKTQNKETKVTKKPTKDPSEPKGVDEEEETSGKLVDVKQKDKTVTKIKKENITAENQWQQQQPEPEIPQQLIAQAKPAGKVFNKDVTKTGQQKPGGEGYALDVNNLPSLDQGVKESQQQNKKDKQLEHKKTEKKEEKPQEKKGLFQNSNKKTDAPVVAKPKEEQKHPEEQKHVAPHPVATHTGPVSFTHSKKEDNIAHKQVAHVPEVKHEQNEPEKHVEPVKVIEAKNNFKFSNSGAAEKKTNDQVRQQSRSPQHVTKQKSPPHQAVTHKTVNHPEKATEHVVAAPKHFVNSKKTDEVPVAAQKPAVQQHQETQKQDHPKKDHPKQDHPKQDHPKQDHPKQDHPKQDHQKEDHPKQDHPKQDHPKQDHQKEEKGNNLLHKQHSDEEWTTVEDKQKKPKTKPQHHRINEKGDGIFGKK